MYSMIDILLLFFGSICLASGHIEFMWIVCMMMTTLAAVCFCLSAEHAWLNIGVYVAGLAVTLLLPVYLAFFPILLYLALSGIEKMEGKIWKSCFVVAAAVPITAFAIYMLKNSNTVSGMNQPIFAGFPAVVILELVTAVVLENRTDRGGMLYRKTLRLLDDAREEKINARLEQIQAEEQRTYEVHLATLTERNRIAREIHDNVGHMLSRSILQIGAVMALNQDELLEEPLQQLRETLDEAMNNVRSSVHDLHDESVELASALQDLLADVRKNYQVYFDYDVVQNMPRSMKYAIMGIVKEALSNIVKHSNATEIRLTVREQPAFYQLMISDNGSTVLQKSPEDIPADGIGIINMKQRVEALSGIFRINTERGFSIFITFPKKEEN